MHPQRVRERVVAADRDQDVDSERLDHPQRVIGEVERAVALDPVREMWRDLLRPDPARVRARGVQERAARAVDRADDVRVERHEPVARVEPGSSGSYSSSAAQPRRKPITSCPSCATRLTTALMQGLRPGTSPPPVRIPIRIASASSLVCSMPILIQDWVERAGARRRRSRPGLELSQDHTASSWFRGSWRGTAGCARSPAHRRAARVCPPRRSARRPSSRRDRLRRARTPSRA